MLYLLVGIEVEPAPGGRPRRRSTSHPITSLR